MNLELFDVNILQTIDNKTTRDEILREINLNRKR